MRRLAFLLLLAGCDSPAPTPPAAPKKAPPRAEPGPPPAPEALADALAAAAALRLYYEHLGRRDYRAAWRLRERQRGLDFDRFAASFADYADYRATVGLPSLPAEAHGFVWVDAPVQLYGRRVDGRPFGSVGRVMMKRRVGTRAWRIAG